MVKAIPFRGPIISTILEGHPDARKPRFRALFLVIAATRFEGWLSGDRRQGRLADKLRMLDERKNAGHRIVGQPRNAQWNL